MQLCKNQSIIIFLNSIEKIFYDIKIGSLEIISKIKSFKSDEFPVVTNTRNNEGNTLLQVAITKRHKNIANELLKMLR